MATLKVKSGKSKRRARIAQQRRVFLSDEQFIFGSAGCTWYVSKSTGIIHRRYHGANRGVKRVSLSKAPEWIQKEVMLWRLSR